MNMHKLILFSLFFVGAISVGHAQDSLMTLLSKGEELRVDYTEATFKTTKVVIGTSSENMPKGNLLFQVTHHFGAINSGYENLFGLKQSTVRIGVEYGLTDRIGIGAGLNTIQNTWDGFAKVKVLRQSTGARRMPFTLAVFGSTSIYTTKWANPDRKNYFTSRMAYCAQLILARKFTESLSLQLAPTYVHKNLVATYKDNNNIFSIGMGGRMKISHRVSINAEYYYLLPGQISSRPAFSSFSTGVDIETGGHVFQIFLTNSMGEHMESIISETGGSWFNGNIYLGFNITRIFTVVNRKM